jgi:hypothetical protein
MPQKYLRPGHLLFLIQLKISAVFLIDSFPDYWPSLMLAPCSFPVSQKYHALHFLLGSVVPSKKGKAISVTGCGGS